MKFPTTKILRIFPFVVFLSSVNVFALFVLLLTNSPRVDAQQCVPIPWPDGQYCVFMGLGEGGLPASCPNAPGFVPGGYGWIGIDTEDDDNGDSIGSFIGVSGPGNGTHFNFYMCCHH